MSNKKKSRKPEAATKSKASEKPNKQEAKTTALHRDGMRETVESFVIALILAFMFKTFEAEAFVIPTGSMAPTLRGMHLDYETDQGLQTPVGVGSHGDITSRPTYAVDPLYGKWYPVHSEEKYNNGQSTVNPEIYSGDRILVSKVAYLFQDPKRWDVIVFKPPEDRHKNYIKRAVGLPGEVIKVSRGDVRVRKPGESEFEVATKPPQKMLAMMQLVYDTEFPSKELASLGWPNRWLSLDGEDDPWRFSNFGQHYSLQRSTSDLTWLRYQHVMPSFLDWKHLEQGIIPRPRRQLITDFSPYNDPSDHRNPYQLGVNWVSDLMIDARVTLQEIDSDAELRLELIKGGKPFQVRIDPNSGEASLWKEGTRLATSKQPTAIQEPGTYRIGFSNVDHQLRLWVNESLVEFDHSTQYESWSGMRPTEADLFPAGIGATGLTLETQRLRLLRDIYYIAAFPNGENQHDFQRKPIAPGEDNGEGWADFYSDPERWDVFAHGLRERLFAPLEDNQFLAFGDNSLSSSDSRLWSPSHPAVERRYLIGKAIFVYWPHGWTTDPYVSIPFRGSEFRFPFYPDFSRMKLIR